MFEKWVENVGESIKSVTMFIAYVLFSLTIIATIIIFFIFVTDSYGQEYAFLVLLIGFALSVIIIITSLFLYAFGCMTQDIQDIKKKICGIEQKENNVNNNIDGINKEKNKDEGFEKTNDIFKNSEFINNVNNFKNKLVEKDIKENLREIINKISKFFKK